MDTSQSRSAMEPTGGYSTGAAAPTWAERRQWQPQDERQRLSAKSAVSFGARKLAHLRFERWLYRTGRIVR